MRYPRYPVYKDSGVEWLGEIPVRWDTRRLKYAAVLNPDSLTEDTEAESHLRYVDIGSVDSTGRILEVQEFSLEKAPSRARRKVKHGDTIISTVRTYLRAIAFIDHPPENLIVSTGFAVLRPEREIEPKYLWRLVQSSGFVDTVVANSVGIGYPAIPSSRLAELPIWIPPLSEQRAIAAFLDRETARIDALIRKQERLIDLLEEKRAALISHTVTKGLDPDVEMKDSGVEWLGKIPAHWEVRRLKFLVTEMRAGPFGSSLTKSMYTSEGYRVYGQEQVIPADFSIGDYYVSPEKYASMQQYAVSPGDVLVSCVGTFGKTAVVPEDIEPGIINPRLIKLTLVRGLIAPEYLRLFLESSIAFGQMEQVSRGGTMDVINIALLSHLWVPFPTLHEQRATLDFLGEKTTKIDALIDKTEAMIERLQEYRTALISAAVTGKIDVRREV